MWWLPLLVLWMEVGDHGLYFIHFYILNDIKGWSDQDGKILLDLQHWQGREWFKVMWNSMLTRSENLSLQMNHFLVCDISWLSEGVSDKVMKSPDMLQLLFATKNPEDYFLFVMFLIVSWSGKLVLVLVAYTTGIPVDVINLHVLSTLHVSRML